MTRAQQLSVLSRFMPLRISPAVHRSCHLVSALYEPLRQWAQGPVLQRNDGYGPGAGRKLDWQCLQAETRAIEVKDRARQRREEVTCGQEIGPKVHRDCPHADTRHIEPPLLEGL